MVDVLPLLNINIIRATRLCRNIFHPLLRFNLFITDEIVVDCFMDEYWDLSKTWGINANNTFKENPYKTSSFDWNPYHDCSNEKQSLINRRAVWGFLFWNKLYSNSEQGAFWFYKHQRTAAMRLLRKGVISTYSCYKLQRNLWQLVHLGTSLEIISSGTIQIDLYTIRSNNPEVLKELKNTLSQPIAHQCSVPRYVWHLYKPSKMVCVIMV